MSSRYQFSAVIPLFLLCGCARVVIEKGGVGQGYDVYRPEPYLLVYYQTTVVTEATVPNPTPPAGKEAKAPGGDNSGAGGGAGGAGGSGGGGSGGAGGEAEGLNGPGALVVWLPNYAERYRVHSESFIAQAGAQFTIRDGWMLTGITDQSDSTALLTAASTVLSSALGTGSGGGNPSKTTPGTKATGGETTTTTSQRFELYKFLFDPDGNFYGLAPVSLTDTKLAQIRQETDSKARLQPLRAPTYDGRQPEDRKSRDADSSKKP